MRVLVVEDERTFVTYVKRGLEEKDYAVDLGFNSHEVLNQLGATPFDLVVTNVILLVLRWLLTDCTDVGSDQRGHTHSPAHLGRGSARLARAGGTGF